MTQPKRFKDGDALFRYALQTVISDGVSSAPRGKPVIELPYPIVLVLENPAAPLVTSPGRRVNYRFGMAEAMWILSGRDDLESLRPYNKLMATYSDDGVRMWGAYGPLVMGQLPHVISTLKRDRDSRQAISVSWRPMVHEVQPSSDCLKSKTAFAAARAAGLMTETDVTLSCDTDAQRSMFPSPRWDGASWRSKDVPCTVAWHFTVRDGALILTVFMRSNDVWLGLPYDLLNFTTVQRVVASMLDLKVGEYRHIVSNLHIYEPNRESADGIVYASVPKGRRRIVLPSFDLACCGVKRVMQLADETLTGSVPHDTAEEPGFHAYYSVIHRQNTWNSSRHVPVR